MLEEKDLNSEERVRLECLQQAVMFHNSDDSAGTVVQTAEKFHDYVRGVKENV